MSRIFPGRRAAWLIFMAIVVIAGYLGLVEVPQTAQERPHPQAPRAKYEQFARSDEITNDIRNANKELVKVRFHSIADRENASKLGRIVQDFGSYAVIASDKRSTAARAKFDAVRLDASVNLPGKKFDPADVEPEGTVRSGEEARGGRGYYIIQLGGLTTDEWLDSLRDAGVEILQYVPHQAFLVYGETSAIAKAAAHARVRWVGAFRAEHKLSDEVRSFGNGKLKEKYDVAVFANADLGLKAAEIGGRIISTSKLSNNFFNVVRVELSPSELERVASIDGVVRIDPFIPPTAEDERAAQIVAGNYSSVTTLNPPGYNPLAQFGVDGTGVTVSVVDDGVSIPGNGGFYLTSANTVHGPLRGATAGAQAGHGHLNASIIAGNTPFGTLDPLGYNYGLGVAPKANIINIPFLVSGNTTTDAQAVDDTLNTLGPNGVAGSISNNSWGDGTNGNSYDSLAAQYDGFVRDASLGPAISPFSIIFSAGNMGTSGLTRPKMSKNTISVANSENIRPELGAADNIDDLRSSSSRGPAADGRIKPDVTAPGTVITGSQAGNCNLGASPSCFDPNHGWSSGTSHAAPQVAGAAALFTQFWKNGHLGENPPPSLIKAAIINTAEEMNGSLTTAARPNGAEGWGRINMKRMLNAGVPIQYLSDFERSFDSTGEQDGFVWRVADATKPVRVSLVWTDPPGVGNPALVNNLDLTVTINGNTYRGNNFTAGSSTTGGTASTVDNVENVFLPSGLAAGTSVTVTIDATAINGDGVLGNGDLTDQNYSLVAYNLESVPAQVPPTVADFDGDRKTDISIFRPAGAEWWYQRSSNNQTIAAQFGNPTDRLVPADYTGDGRSDIAVWRPSTGQLFVLRSEDWSFYAVPFGLAGDDFVPRDFDGDQKADAAVFRPSISTWFIAKSTGGTDIIPFGASTDLPVPADYDADNRADIAIFRPSSGQWWINRSSLGLIVVTFGTSSDKLVQGDYTGDGRADVAVWRPSTGQWFVLRTEDFSFYAVPFGSSTDLPTPGDYDGDGKFDTAVFRPSSSTWFVDRSTAGIHIQNFGSPGDMPVPNALVR